MFEKVLNENILIHMKKQREKKLFNLKSQIASIDSKLGEQNNNGMHLKKNISALNANMDIENIHNPNSNTNRNSQKRSSQKNSASPRNYLHTPNSNLPNENSNIAQNSADNYNNNGEIIEENENLN